VTTEHPSAGVPTLTSSNRTVAKHLVILHGSFRRAMNVWGLPTNPAATVERPRYRVSDDLDAFSPEDVWALVRSAGSDQDAAPYLTAAFMGLRMEAGNAARAVPNNFAVFSVITMLVTAATVSVYRLPITDPVELVGKIGITSVVAVLVCPWYIYSSSVAVDYFLGGVGALLGPLFGMMMVDFFRVRKSNVKLEDLYVEGPESSYWYSGGWKQEGHRRLCRRRSGRGADRAAERVHFGGPVRLVHRDSSRCSRLSSDQQRPRWGCDEKAHGQDSSLTQLVARECSTGGSAIIALLSRSRRPTSPSGGDRPCSPTPLPSTAQRSWACCSSALPAAFAGPGNVGI
jgi:Permease for cytosine/purines, uracil, thiamine, allantoin